MWVGSRRVAAFAALLGLVFAGATLSPASAQTPASPPLKITAGSSWINEDGSILAISAVGPNGQLTGTFTTTAGCGAKQGHPVTGWYYAGATGGAVTFAVTWTGCNSVTSWSGQFNNATSSFHVLWHLAVAAAPVWNGIVSGAHTFVLQPPKKP